ncbi:single-stranded DNA-binding protein [Pseudolysinimonas sp.]|uniref:single-stranded DNA-binding protein n=1 Tax=Pseudolysinimonas sp. TaxID=2680009 RepID=UPI003F812796
MSDTITLTGLVATTPRHLVTSEGLPITSFRLASTARRYDRGEGRWVDGDTNWFTVTAFRHLATNAVGSIAKGQRVLVTGRLRVREWQTDDKRGTNVEIDAEALGHDLSWGTAVFTRTIASSLAERSTGSSDAEPSPEGFPETPAPDEAPADELAAARAQRAAEPALPF